MDHEILTIKQPLRKNYQERKTSFNAFDLPFLIAKLKGSNSWNNGELSAMILLKRQGKQVMLTAVRGGTEIVSFQSDDSVTIQIIEGSLMFQTRKKSVTLDKGQLLILHEKVEYTLVADEETMFLLTIANSGMHIADN
ncbi:MAG: hypothetical protein R6W78_16640 [Bacteroidales bacterium]